MNGWLEWNLPMKPQPPFTTPQRHGTHIIVIKNTHAFHAKFMADSKFKATLNYDEFVYVPPYQDAKLLLFLFLSDGI